MCDLFRCSARKGGRPRRRSRPALATRRRRRRQRRKAGQEDRRRGRAVRFDRQRRSRPAARPDRRRTGGAARRGDPRHFGILPDARAHLARIDCSRRASASSPSKAIGRMPRGSIIMCGIFEYPPPEWTAFARFPTWMWRNNEVRGSSIGCATTMRRRAPRQRAAIYGLDLYSLYASIGSVLKYLDEVDPQAARVARQRYGCLTPWQARPRDLRPCRADRRIGTCEPNEVE